MNQILYTGGKKNKNKPTETQKIVIFFVIFMIIFAICAIVIGANLLTKVKTGDAGSNVAGSNTTTEEPTKSDIKIQFEPELGTIKVNVESSQNLKSVSYWWDEEEPTLIETSETKYELKVSSKQGIHKLNVKVIDENEYEKAETRTVIGDSEPELKIATDGVSNYVITAKDDTELDRIEIDLNGKKEVIKVNDKQIEYKIAIPQGDSIISVTAYNLNGISVNKKAKITNFGG